jgi:hypothetical protein
MACNMNAREKILERLITFQQPIDGIQAALATFPWDSETELVFLTPDNISSILRRYSAGDLGAKEIESWANMIEGRDDVGFGSHQELTRDIMHELANPLLTQPFTPNRYEELLSRIGSLSTKKE